jgi:hypothetical protein
MHRAIILAAGKGRRWKSISPKHYLEIDGERIIQRSIRMANTMFDDVVVAVPGTHYVTGAREHVVSDPLRGSEQQKILSSKEEWSAGRTTLLYGDVYYTEVAMRALVESDHQLTFLIRHGASHVTGKPHGEIYAIGFLSVMQKKITDAMAEFGYVEGIPSRAGWWLWHCFRDIATEIVVTDETEDFDTLQDYQRWCESRG